MTMMMITVTTVSTLVIIKLKYMWLLRLRVNMIRLFVMSKLLRAYHDNNLQLQTNSIVGASFSPMF